MVKNEVEGFFSNGKSFYEYFETHGILWRFLNPWYLMEVLKPMVFYGGS